jgi:hypothetical protein
MLFTAYQYLSIFLVITMLLVVVLCFKRWPQLTLLATVISIFLKGHYLWLGAPIYAWQASGLLGLLMLVTQSNLRKKNLGKQLSMMLTLNYFYFGFTILVSCLFWITFYFEPFRIESSVRGKKMVLQLINIFLMLGLFSLGQYLSRAVTSEKFLQLVLDFCFIVAVLALIQFFVFKTLELNIFPVLGSDGSQRSTFLKDYIFRVNSIVGEPKHLGILMAFGLAAFGICLKSKVNFRFPKMIYPCIFITSILLSFSTTGMYISIILLLFVRFLLFKRVRLPELVFYSLILILTPIVVAGIDENLMKVFLSQVTKGSLEVQDLSILRALIEYPYLTLFGSGLGNIHHFAVSYLPSDFPLFKDAPYKANSGLLYIIGDIGMVGLMLFLSAQIYPYKVLSGIRKTNDHSKIKEAEISILLLYVTLIAFMLRYTELIFLVSGFVMVRLSLLRARS